MAEEKEINETKAKKMADPAAATIDPASRQMIERAHELGIETAFDRARERILVDMAARRELGTA